MTMKKEKLLSLSFVVICMFTLPAADGKKITILKQGDVLRRLMMSRNTNETSQIGEEKRAAPVERFNPSKLLPQDGLKEKDKITKLFGQPDAPVAFQQYSGYVTVDKNAGRNLFYYFAEAPDAAKRPLLLWLNGGPGCSSFGIGAFEEIGPFRVKSDGKTLFRNPYAWNHVANVLFLDSPTGVGFSYSINASDYDKNGDARTAEDAYIFLVNWLERFPEYKSRDLYLAGESYAGHFVPQLAHAIHRYNRRREGPFFINLKGIAVGNGAINEETDSKGTMDFFWTHALISDENHREIEEFCQSAATADGSKCIAALDKAEEAVRPIDIYNIYASSCQKIRLVDPPKPASVRKYDACSDFYVLAYLNNPEARKAVHADGPTRAHNMWMICSELLWTDSARTVLPILKELTADGIRVMIYSGDVDGKVPVTATRYSVNALGLPVKTQWYPWKISGQVGGYAEEYEGNLTLATVRGAGLQVPSNKPWPALVIIRSFIDGEPLPPFETDNL